MLAAAVELGVALDRPETATCFVGPFVAGAVRAQLALGVRLRVGLVGVDDDRQLVGDDVAGRGGRFRNRIRSWRWRRGFLRATAGGSDREDEQGEESHPLYCSRPRVRIGRCVFWGPRLSSLCGCVRL